MAKKKAEIVKHVKESENRELWIKERQKGLGGSDTPVVFGLSPYMTRKELWMDKLGLLAPREQTRDMLRGKKLEPLAAEAYEEKTGRSIKRHPESLSHKLYPFLKANIDRHIISPDPEMGPGVLEIKCPRYRQFQTIKFTGVPDMYVLQLQHYLMVKNWKWGSFCIFSAEAWEVLHFDIEADSEIHAKIIEQDSKFWELVEKKIEPQDDAPMDVKDLDLPEIKGKLVKFDSDEFLAAVQNLKEDRELTETADMIKEQAENKVKILMEQNSAEIVEGGGARIYFMSQERESFQRKEMQKDYPDLPWKKYIKTSKSKVFRPYFFNDQKKLK